MTDRMSEREADETDANGQCPGCGLTWTDKRAECDHHVSAANRQFVIYPDDAKSDPEEAAHREQIRAHFDSEPLNLLILQDGTRVDDQGMHRVCGQECIDLFAESPEFNCFHDGCEYECCGCGRCCAPAQCSDSGKGYTWHA